MIENYKSDYVTEIEKKRSTVRHEVLVTLPKEALKSLILTASIAFSSNPSCSNWDSLEESMHALQDQGNREAHARMLRKG